MELQNKLKFAEKGKDFLEFRREQLIKIINEYWNEYQTQQKEFLSLFRSVMLLLNQTYKEMGKKNFKIISSISKIRFEPQLNLKYAKKAGIIIPYIYYELLQEKQLPAYSFETTSHYLDDLIILLKNLLEPLMRTAEIEDVLLKFALNFKKIDRRINALKNIIIPNLQLDIKNIRDVLEEVEREEYVRLKIIKDKISASKV